MRTLIFIVSFLVLLLGVVGVSGYAYSTALDGPARVAKVLQKEHMRTLQSLVGPENTHAIVVHLGRDLNELLAHEVGHAIGQVLFESRRAEALAICGSSLTYGCMHQVMGQLLNEEGIGALETLRHTCDSVDVTQREHCVHGIGHGLTFALGYDDDQVVEALSICDDIDPQTNQHPRFLESCHGGAFMEHVYRFLDDANPPKEITPEEFYSFCKNMPDTQSIRFCVVWSVSWYHYVSSNYAYTPDAFAQLGAFCRAFPDLSERGVDVVSDCFGSIGNQLWADRMLRSDDAIALCAGAVTHAREEALCTLGAASAFVRVGNTKEVPALCGSLGDEENKAQRCLLYAGYE